VHVHDADAEAGERGVAKPMSFNSSRKATVTSLPSLLLALGNELRDLLLLQLLVHEPQRLGVPRR